MAKKKEQTALVLRCCNAELRSSGGFQWPDQIGAVVEAPDWQPTNECGNGLHGWLYGAGDSGVSDYVRAADAKWLVVEVVLADVIALGGKVKFPRCTIRHIGDKASASEYLFANEPNAAGLAVIGAKLTGGNYATLTGGDGATLTGGYGATLTGGEKAELRFRYWDDKAERNRTKIAYVGEDGIKPHTAYRLDDAHNVVEVAE